ncbi:hypothetical protein VN97_g10286 [Penicillium thymicola]|uniref:Ham1 family protein n=1 Tax=Penicillium thymicola TaxID=293382 RepID=A0AAI9T9C4_PENTH|nr:hypothetical protein VN97_g10286 [Penicillium thymicola]
MEIPGIQGSLEEIARDKCRKAAIAVNGTVLTEDSALEFRALKGLPGPYMGEGGFAFDPIFEVEGQTYAEMSFAYKNTVSERFKALEKLQDWLRNTA